jgi:serine/threonine protein kinase
VTIYYSNEIILLCIIQFIGACKEPTVLVVVTELLQGGSLKKLLLSMRPNRLDQQLAVKFALDIAEAMDCLHKHGIIHRDLKPGNNIIEL